MTGGNRKAGAALASRLAVLASTAAVLMAAAACGAAASTPPATSSTTDAVLGAVHRAQGDPIVLAMINEETGQLGTFPEVRQSAQAVVDYVNTYRNGVHGRPLKLATCASDGTPPSAAACANRLLDQHPVSVAAGFDIGADGSVPIFAKAALAYVGYAPIGAQEQTNANAIEFSAGSAGVFGAEADYAGQTLHATKASVIYPNLPVGQFTLNAFILPQLKAYGVASVKTVAQDPSGTDWTASMAAASGSSPDAIIAVTPGNACVSVMQAHLSLGSTAKLFTTNSCAAPALIKAAGPAAEGTYMPASLLPSDPNPDVKLYKAIIKQFGPADMVVDPLAQGAATEIMNVWQAFNSIPAGQLTTATIFSTFRGAANQPSFMDHPFTCDGQQLKGSPAVCSVAQHMTVVKSGQLQYVDNRWYQAAG